MKPENIKLLQEWINRLYHEKTFSGLSKLSDELQKDLQLILDFEKETTRSPADGPADGETWEQYCERKALTGMINAANGANMDHIET